MKKAFLFLISLFFCTLACSCNKKVENGVLQNDSFPHYVYIGENCYDNGRIYSSEPTMFINFENMEKSVLCSKPNCTHKDSECVAKIIGDCPVIYKNYIYFFKSNQDVIEQGNGKREFHIDSRLCRVSLNSFEVEEVVKFTDCVPRYYDGMIVYNNELLFTGDNMNPTQDEYGNISASNCGGIHYLCSINLENGKYLNHGSIYDGDKTYEAASYTSAARIMGYYNSKVYIEYSFCKNEITSEQIKKEHDPGDYFTVIMFDYDLETMNLQESELPLPSYLDYNTYVYYDKKNDNSVVLRDNDKIIIDSDVGTNAYVVNNKLFIPNKGDWFDLKDKSKHSMGKYINYNVIKYIDGYYILTKGNETLKINEDDFLS